MTMGNYRQAYGKQGETIAVRQLKKNGYTILERNYRTKAGEIDIIARHDDTIVFIEVKARSGRTYGNPKHAVTRAKQHKIVHTATMYLKATRQLDRRIRFDVVAIHPETSSRPVEIIRNAFDVTGMA